MFHFVLEWVAPRPGTGTGEVGLICAYSHFNPLWFQLHFYYMPEAGEEGHLKAQVIGTESILLTNRKFVYYLQHKAGIH